MSGSTQSIGVQRVAALFLAVALGFGGRLSVTRAVVDKSDATLATKAAATGMLEVQANQVATTRAGNLDIRAFTQKVAKGHTVVGDEFKTLIDKKGIVMPEGLPADERAKVDKLSALEGTKFDKAYVDEVDVKVRKEAVSLSDRASKDMRDPDIKVFFVHNLPALCEYLQMAEQLKTAVK